ncbi:glycosyltransferase [Aggregatimonas sangjinii]|uniref:Glycosyltransferase n=1 Tax=Aggregatimonas sangjinii TaxID=2583587 RepID=A0A5B7SRK9_9FLAO|nr:glycosyltransferase [Aggregatimonas sangjinii]QCW99662.1 glycosyltransferase [Aggregatimonas sangjinii]
MDLASPKISVVIPVYKVKDTLHQCVDSVIAQTYTNLEIILVNDGSPDSCGAICDEYAKKDDRIKVIHQENQGLSMARNNGIKVATGTYFGCVDSDDYIRPKMYELLLKAMLAHKLQVVECSLQKGESTYFEQEDKVIVEPLDTAFERIVYPGFYNVWNKLYAYDLIKDIQFEKDKIYEDILFLSQVYQKIDKLGFIPLALYYYSQEGESIMRSNYGQKKLDGFWVIKRAMENFFNIAKTPRAKEILRKNYLGNLQYHFHSLLENPHLDPSKDNLKKMRSLIIENSKKPYLNPYIKLINTLPFWGYRMFYKLNKQRLKLRN